MNISVSSPYVSLWWCGLISGVVRSLATCIPADTYYLVPINFTEYLSYEDACWNPRARSGFKQIKTLIFI
uniref:Secreted protein n=1 Tax=Strongyloides venezuelensis TaxID=75913 RepID=A0A0K0G5B4_STRVS